MRRIGFFGAALVGTLGISSLAPGQPAPGPLGQPPGAGQPAAPAAHDNKIGGKSLDEWIKELHSTDSSERMTACQAVLAYKEEGRKAVPDLIRLLSDHDHSVRTNAVISIGALGWKTPEQGKEEAIALTRMLADSQGAVRYQTAMALARLGPDVARSAASSLTETLRDQGSWEVRKAAAFALGQLGYDLEKRVDARVISALVLSLSDRALQVRLAVIHALIQLGPPPRPADAAAAKQTLLTMVQSKDKATQIWTRVALMRFDKALLNDTYLTPIAQYLKGPEQPVRVEAAAALGLLGPEAKTKVPDLIAALGHEDLVTKFAAIVALGQIGTAARQAAGDLEPLTKHPDPIIKAAADQSLRQVQGSNLPAPPPGAQGPPRLPGVMPGRPGGQ
jgi:HEAT repeat protein